MGRHQLSPGPLPAGCRCRVIGAGTRGHARRQSDRPLVACHPADMEPRPADRGPGRIIFLNGASSSGKSILAKALQEALPEPFLHVIDRRECARGDRRTGEGRTHVETDRIHTFGPYDLDIDTIGGITRALTDHVLGPWRARGPHRALRLSKPGTR